MSQNAPLPLFLAEKKLVLEKNSYLVLKLWLPKFEAWRKNTNLDWNYDKLIRDFGLHLIKKGLKTSSTYTALNATRRYLRWLKENGTVVAEQYSPTLPKVPRETLFTPTEDQVGQILNRVKELVPEPYATAISLLPLTGMRDSEMLTLTLDDGDIKDGRVTFMLHKTKMKRSREVPMLKTGTPLLQKYLTSIRPTFQSKSRWLFPKPKKGSTDHIDQKSMERHIRNLRDKLNIPNLTAHAFRRFYVTYLVGAGVREAIIAKIIGHTDLSLFDRYFGPDVNFLSDRLTEAEDTIDARKDNRI